MFARLTFVSLALALLTLPAFLAPATADAPSSLTVVVDTAPTVTTTGHAFVTLKDSTGAPVAGTTLHVIISWASVPTVTKPSVVNQVAVKTGADGVAEIVLPFDQGTAKINWPGDHGLTVRLDGTGIEDSLNYQVGTGLA